MIGGTARGLVVALVAAACGPLAPASPAAAPTGSPRPEVNPSSIPTATPAQARLLLEPASAAVGAPAFADLISTPDGFVALAPWDEDVIVRGSADGATWVRLAGQPALSSPLEDLVVGPSGWVATQRVEGSKGNGIGAAVWISADGRAWDQLPDQAALGVSFNGPLSAGPWGYAMAGQVIDGSGTSVPAVWTSRDGRRWQREESQAGGSGFQDVFVTSTGVVAVDRDLGRLVMTTDGSGWSKPVEDPRFVEALVGLGPDGQSLVVITGGEDGLAVRLATVHLEASMPEIAWDEAGPASFDGVGATGLATGERGALLLGFDTETLAPRTWHSTDGRTWERTDLDPATFGGGVPTLAAVGRDAFVVLGWEVSTAGAVRTQPWISRDGRTWAPAAADALGTFPVSPAASCPPARPTDVAELIAMTDAEDALSAGAWPACFGDRPLAIEGWIQGCGGCGGVPVYRGSPSWLLDPEGYAAFWLSSDAEPEGPGGGIGIQIDPGGSVTAPDVGIHARVTGHFDDPAAATCRLIPLAGWFVPVPPAAQSIARCRSQFVAERIEALEP